MATTNPSTRTTSSKPRRPLPKRTVLLGARVTCRLDVPAYQDRAVWFRPGDEGIVAARNVPCVTYHYRAAGGTASFVCVDFERNGKTYRCSLYYNNIRILSDKEKEVT